MRSWRLNGAHSSADDLPDIRHEAIPHLLRVFSIPRQIVREELLLVEDSPDQPRRDESKNRESPPGAEREGDAYHHDQDSHIHRMPNASVETGEPAIARDLRSRTAASTPASFPAHAPARQPSPRQCELPEGSRGARLPPRGGPRLWHIQDLQAGR